MSDVELRLLFWNMRRQAQAAEYAVELCAEHEPHVLVTAETPDELALMLQQRTPSLHNLVWTIGSVSFRPLLERP